MKHLLLLCVLGITGATAGGCVYHDRPYHERRDVIVEPVPARGYYYRDGYYRDHDWRWRHEHGYY